MSAFRASYADLKVIKTRQCVQVIFELPISDFDAAYEILGGLPNSSVERWFGIAALVAGAGTPTASPLMADGKEKGSRNLGGYHEVAPTDVKSERKEAGREEPTPARPRKDWRDLGPAQQAGIRCEEPVFAAFLKENHPDDWREAVSDAAECVRLLCQVSSRSELATNHRARVIWKQLDDEFAAWKALERA